jgi:GNAT superfamily N-acetyltransferase
MLALRPSQSRDRISTRLALGRCYRRSESARMPALPVRGAARWGRTIVVGQLDFSNLKKTTRGCGAPYYGRSSGEKGFEMSIRIRVATTEDVPVLRGLIDASVRELQAGDYTAAQIDGALRTVFGVDSQLIADGTYLVAEADGGGVRSTAVEASVGIAGTQPLRSSGQAGVAVLPRIAGCGGWSKRKTLYGGDRWTQREDSLLDPLRDAAKIRAFFVHPAWARRGVGTLILDACETAARAAGFSRFEMGATLTGAKLFGVKGYVAVKRIDVALGNGEVLPVIHMEKREEGRK